MPAGGQTYGLAIWFQTADELEAGVRALGAHPSFAQWHRKDYDGWPEVACGLDAMFVADRDDGLTEALDGLCSMARLETGKKVGAWLTVYGSYDEGAATYRALVDSFEFPVEAELYVYPDAHEDVRTAELDAWLLEIATAVHQCVPFRVAVIDFEILASYEEALGRSDGVLRAKGDELRWYPNDTDARDR